MCVYGHSTTIDAMSPRTNLRVAGHLGVRLLATPPPRGALDDEELSQPLSGESEKWAKPASKSSLSSVDD